MQNSNTEERSSTSGNSTVHHTRVRSLCRRTQLCTFYAFGRCNRGAHCNFAHGNDALSEKPVFYKTRLCHFRQRDRCQNGAHCFFAHSKDELRNPDRAENFNPDRSHTGRLDVETWAMQPLEPPQTFSEPLASDSEMHNYQLWGEPHEMREFFHLHDEQFHEMLQDQMQKTLQGDWEHEQHMSLQAPLQLRKRKLINRRMDTGVPRPAASAACSQTAAGAVAMLRATAGSMGSDDDFLDDAKSSAWRRFFSESDIGRPATLNT